MDLTQMNEPQNFDEMPVTDAISIESKGNYAEITITRDNAIWRLLVDEKNLAKFLYTARQVLDELRFGREEGN